MNVNDMVLQMINLQKQRGYTPATVLCNYRDKYVPLIVFYELHDTREWDPEITKLYRDHINRRVDSGEICQNWYRRLKSGVDEMEHFHETGKLIWPFYQRRRVCELSDYYQNVKDEYLKSEDFHSNTPGDIIWICDRYFSWLQSQGINSLEKTNSAVIQQYILECSKEMASSSLYNIRLYMKNLYAYLYKRGYVADSYELLFSFRVSRERPQQSAADPDEVQMTLSVIDRHTSQGRRDYAIILLGAELGLRAGDIIHMKLRDIDWAGGEIHICQSKTMEPLVLPLTKNVGEALQDYILNGRPKCDYEEIFIRLHAPHQPFVDGTGIQYLYSRYRRKAGLSRKAFDGKGFHSLRRSVGKRMVTSGVPVTTVAQVLGHTDINSTQRYISLDSVHLKECALDFHGIEVDNG